jgi:hypothetical protein
MITVMDFNGMSIAEQAGIALNGNFLSDRKDGNVVVQLHRLDNFYVEVFYDQESNEILRYEGFTNTKRLVPYLKL